MNSTKQKYKVDGTKGLSSKGNCRANKRDQNNIREQIIPREWKMELMMEERFEIITVNTEERNQRH